MITLTHLRALLERALTHAENSAIVRLTDRTVEGVARAYLSRWMPWGSEVRETLTMIEWSGQVYGKATLDLTDPGTAHALLVALALSLGLDPGVGGLRCTWSRFVTCWQVESRAEDGQTRFHLFMPRSHGEDDALGRSAPTVAAEPDSIKALAFAALHVLEHP
jgi:hypothetical protein